MKHVAQRYAQHVNRRHGRNGTLWAGRFRSCLVDEDAYLLACQRYIELNPVRAGMVRHPRDYAWSSYRSNAEGKASALLIPHERYEALARTPSARRLAYRELFRAPLGAETLDAIRLATNGGFVLGAPAFQAAVARRLGRRVSRGRPGRPPKSATAAPATTRKRASS
jgi:putative transposase